MQVEESGVIYPERDELRRLAKDGVAVLIRQDLTLEEYRVGRLIYECRFQSTNAAELAQLHRIPGVWSGWLTFPPHDAVEPFAPGIPVGDDQFYRSLRFVLYVIGAIIVAWLLWKFLH